MRAGPVNHILQPDDGWERESSIDRMDFTATVDHQGGFLRDEQPQRSPHFTDVNRLVIGVQNENDCIAVPVSFKYW